MPKRSMKQDDPLEDFTRRDITLDGATKVVYIAGAGPAVIVMTAVSYTHLTLPTILRV